MAARSRPRGGQRTDEYDEERVIWNSIKQDGRRVDQLMVRHNFIFVHILVIQHFANHSRYLKYPLWTVQGGSCVNC
jgi:hypothetical protein